MDFDFITSALAVGARQPADAWGRLASELGVRRVVDVRLEACDDQALLAGHGIELLHLPTADCTAIAPELIDRGVAWVVKEIASGEKVLVHCQHGIGRSALFAACALVGLGQAPVEAVRMVKDARPCVMPNSEQLQALIAFAARFAAAARVGWTLPTEDELARIVWRDLRWR